MLPVGSSIQTRTQKACELSNWNDVYCIGTLAAAEAETGKFDDAVRHAEQALAMAKAQKRPQRLLDEMADALACYQQGKPYRDIRK